MNLQNGENPAFLPTNLKLGTSFTFPLADYHNLMIGLDLNKLLVPTRPRESDYDMNSTEGQQEYLDAMQDWRDMSSIKGIFKSFSDAPGGSRRSCVRSAGRSAPSTATTTSSSPAPATTTRTSSRAAATTSPWAPASPSMCCASTHPI